MLLLFEHYHKFIVEDVIGHHEFRCEEPDPEIDPTTNQETAALIQLHFKLYDNYEFDDFGLSQLVVQSLLSPTLLDKITTKFGNDPEFEAYPDRCSSSWPWTPVMLRCSTTLWGHKQNSMR